MALNLRKPKIANNQWANVTPKKKKQPRQQNIGVGQAKKAQSRNQMTSRFQKARATSDFQTPKVTTNNPAVTNAGNPAVASPPTPPPSSPYTNEQRRQADEMLVREQARINKALYDAALAYGDPNLIRQYASAAGADPNVTENPNSAIAQITKAREDAARETEQGMNLRNTFFSGLHNRAQKEVSDDAASQFSAALSQWLSTLGQLTDERKFAISEYSPEGRMYREALIKDIEDAPEAAPKPLSDPASAPSPSGSKPSKQAKVIRAHTEPKKKKNNKKKKPAMKARWA